MDTTLSALIERAIDVAVKKHVADYFSKNPTPMLPDNDVFVGAMEVARRLGMARSSLYRLTTNGTLPPMIQRGTRVGYMKSDLDRLLLNWRALAAEKAKSLHGPQA